jgi:hypothetical protein
MLSEFRPQLDRFLGTQFSDARVELEFFPSGAFHVDIRYQGRLFVCAYSAGGGFGVDEIDEDTGLGEQFRFGASSISELLSILRILMTDSPPSTPRG